LKQFGKTQLVADLRTADFEELKKVMSKQWGLVRVRNVIQYTRSIFKYGVEADLLATPVRFGPGFARPSKKTLRLDRARKGPKMFEPEEIRAMIDGEARGEENAVKPVKPTTSIKAMILLGINCGFGNSDCATLPLSALDLKRGWVNYHRPKTGITRRCPLWPETIAAIKECLDERCAPSDPENAGLVFITAWGGSWYKEPATTRSQRR